jgi:HAD superfamily hydrolase (TIGR01509 family)
MDSFSLRVSCNSLAPSAFPTAPATKQLSLGNRLDVLFAQRRRGNALRMTAPAVLFDIDGTLIDSNYLHVHAWQRAFSEEGFDVESWRIHRLIGMDGSELLETLLPDASEEATKRVEELNSRFYRELTGLLRPLPGALRLLDEVADLGLQAVLATSAPEDELAVLRKVLQRDDLVSAITSSDDVETAKPKPGIVQVALERADVPADHAVFVGDAVWDVRAAKRAGVSCIGVESGGIDKHALESEGAIVVYANAQDLLDHLRDGPIGALASQFLDR